jgi:hypothetical protein
MVLQTKENGFTMTEEQALEVERLYSEVACEIRDILWAYTQEGVDEEIGNAVLELLADRFKFPRY